MLTDQDYKQAVETEGIGQEFLDSIDLEEARPYVKQVIYYPKDLSVKINDGFGVQDEFIIMGTLRSFFGGIGFNRTRSTILVFPTSFSNDFNFFMSTLIDHEGFHARQNYYASRDRNKFKMGKVRGYPECLWEIPDCMNEIYGTRFN